MKKIFFSLMIVGLFLLNTTFIAKAATYTTEEVSKHNTLNDCWMIFDGKVYDFSVSHLNNHADKYMDITGWCGKDMTTAFQTKDGQGQDHKSRTYSDLENYYIGDIGTTTSTTKDTTTGSTSNGSSSTTDTSTTGTNTSTSTTTAVKKSHNPYNFWAPALIAFFGYMGYWGMTKVSTLKKYKLFNRNTFNFTFNSLMLLGLIPSVGFGIFMIAAYSFKALKDIDFDFLYWHVELSVALSVFMLAHFLTRFKVYKAPLNLFRRRKPAI